MTGMVLDATPPMKKRATMFEAMWHTPEHSREKFAVVLFGATGFTGKLCALHFAQHAPSIQWALGGRDVEKLEKLRKDLIRCKYAVPPAGIVVGNLKDPGDCERIARSSRVVLTTCGPYAKYGVDLVRACATNGTHYVDITGEVIPFVRDSVQTLDAIAKKTKATIVHCAGYDSVPSDLLTKLAIDALQTRGESCRKCVVACDGAATKGGASGGTVASMLGIFAHLRSHPKDVIASLDQDLLAEKSSADDDHRRSSFSERNLLVDEVVVPKSKKFRHFVTSWWLLFPGYDPLLGAWHAPFVMAFCNQKIVRLSFALRRKALGTSYKEVLTVLPFVNDDGNWGLFGAVAVFMTSLLMSMMSVVMFLPRCITKHILPEPGTGPSREQRLKGKWTVRVAAEGDQSIARGTVVAEHQDPGYASTAVMVAETALALAESAESTAPPSGVVTPSVACPELTARLKTFGITFSLKVADKADVTTKQTLFGRKTTLFLTLASLGSFLFLRSIEIISVFTDAPDATLYVAAFIVASTLGFVAFAKKKKLSVASRFAVASVIAMLFVSFLLDRVLLWQPPAALDLEGKTYAITGGNSGLGLALGRELTAVGASVILLCRSPERCKVAADSIGAVAYDDLTLDLNDLRSVDAAGHLLKKRVPKLDGLILNAGFYGHPQDGRPNETVQGLEASFGTMHVGHALFEKLVPAKRIVIVSSEAHNLAPSGLFDDPCDKDTKIGPFLHCAYPRAKLANVYMGLALARKKDVVTVTPGFIRTNIQPRKFLRPLFQLMMRSPSNGVRGLLRALVDDTVSGKIVDAMARPRLYEDACWTMGGCNLDDALDLDRLTRKLIRLRDPAVQDDCVPRRIALAWSTILGMIFMKVFWASFVIFTVIVGASAYAILTAASGPTGFVLDTLNAIVQHPTVAPVVDACFWAWTLLCAGLAAPFVLVAGLFWGLLPKPLSKKNQKLGNKKDLGIVITGCDTGFGQSLATELSARGYTVFAGLYQDASTAWLQTMGENVLSSDKGVLPRPLRMDVTIESDVVAAQNVVEAWLAEDKNRKVLAVVNNAGLASGGYTEMLPEDELRKIQEVNYIGVARVCRHFLPLLRSSKDISRIIIVSSLAGKAPMYLGTAYSASKYAVRAYASGLRMEQDIPVCTVMPTFHRTPLFDKGNADLERNWNRASRRLQDTYGQDVFEQNKQRWNDIANGMAWDPNCVVDALVRLTTTSGPLPRELPVGFDAKFIAQLTTRLSPTGFEFIASLPFAKKKTA